MTARRGRLVVLEGGEASGKSTQAELLAERLDAVLTREPGGTPLGERLRTLLLDPSLPALDARTETLLLLAARARHVAEVIEPALASGRHVVCDRFTGSTLAYQGYGRGHDLERLRDLSRWATGGLEPDVVVLLVVPPDVAAVRRQDRGAADRLEGEDAEFFRRVDAGYADLAAVDPLRWTVVDGEGPPAAVAERVLEAVSRHLDAARDG